MQPDSRSSKAHGLSASDRADFEVSGCKKCACLHHPEPCGEGIGGSGRWGAGVPPHQNDWRSWLGGPAHVPRRKILAKYILRLYLAICIRQVCGEDDGQMLARGSLQAVITQSHKPV